MPNYEEIQHLQLKLMMEHPAPFVSAQSWVLYDKAKGQLMFGKCEAEPRQIASLTKIMTALVVLDTMQKYEASQFAQLSSEVKILKPVTQLLGTSAFILPNDRLTVKQLIYGMMLPSGNDAAQALAIYFGQLMLNQEFSFDQDPNANFVLQQQEVECRLKLMMVRQAYWY